MSDYMSNQILETLTFLILLSLGPFITILVVGSIIAKFEAWNRGG